MGTCPLLRLLNPVCLLLVGALLATGNLWCAARRSTVPLALDVCVTGKRVLTEKHPGSDDVYMLDTEDGSALQVDQQVFLAVTKGSRLRKAAWSTRLEHNGQAIQLAYSRDYDGLTKVMLVALAAIAGTLLTARLMCRQDRSESREGRASLEEAIRLATSQHGATLDELSRRRMTLVLFLRHSGCTFCREALGDLRSQRDMLRSQDIEIAIVHMDVPGRADGLLAKYDLGDVHCFSDPDCVLYDAFEIERGALLQVLGPRVWWRGFFTAIVRRHGFGRIAGDIFRLPAVFLLKDGRLAAERRAKSPYERLAFDSLVSGASTSDLPRRPTKSGANGEGDG